jgi:hypothetical protein
VRVGGWAGVTRGASHVVGSHVVGWLSLGALWLVLHRMLLAACCWLHVVGCMLLAGFLLSSCRLVVACRVLFSAASAAADGGSRHALY